MKLILKGLRLAAPALVAAVLAVSTASAHCGKCGMGEEKGGKAAKGAAAKHDCKDGTCPMHKAKCPAKVEGAEVSVANTADGVTITIKGKDAEAVKKIQETGAKMAKGECCGGHGEGKGHEHGHEHGKEKEKIGKE